MPTAIDPPVLEEACLAPSRLIGERCLAPGVQDDGCPAGTLGLADGSCMSPGVLSGACAPGFVSAGDGCEPVLPEGPCGTGLMAVPGETGCRPVMVCGQGRWGDLPTDGSTQHVDYNYAQKDSDGTAQKPWTTIQEAVDAAVAGGLVAVAEGVYAEDVSLSDKPVRLWGVCPDKVTIAGDGADFTIAVRASGSELGGMEIQGENGGLQISSAEGVMIDRLWVHGTGSVGVYVTDEFGPASLLVRDSLIEEVAAGGIVGVGVALTVQASVVRGTQAAPNQRLGRGVNLESGYQLLVRPSLVMDRCVIEGNRDLGVYVSGADATIENTVVRDTLPVDGTQMFGRGIAIQLDPISGEGSDVTLRGLLVDRNHDVGVYLTGSRALIDSVVVRGTALQVATQDGGIGIAAESLKATDKTELVLRSSVVENSHDAGVFIASATADIESTVVRGGRCREGGSGFGRGISVQPDTYLRIPSTLGLRASLIEQNTELGIYVSDSDATIAGTLVVDIAEPCSAQLAGGGIAVQGHADLQPSKLELRTSRIEKSYGVGLWIGSFDASVEDCHVSDTFSYERGLFGDSVLVASRYRPATANLERLLVRDGARAAISSFGSQVTVGAAAIECHPLDLNGELLDGKDWTFEDRGDNRCGCSGEEWSCRQVSSALQAPEPVEPLP